MYVNVGESPSESEALALHCREEEVVTPVLGTMLAETSNTGAVLATVSLALEVTVTLSVSVIVATQVISSVGLEFVADNTNVSPEPNTVPFTSNHS